MNPTGVSCSDARAVRARDAVLAAVAHDLRTPLSSIVAAAALLTSVDALNPERHRIRQRGRTIERAARHMARLLRDLTDADHIDAGRLAIERTVTSPGDVLHETVDALEPSVARAGGTLRLRMPVVLPPMSLDPHRVRQVLANLIVNARDAGASAIVVGADASDAELVCRVSDNGPGISPDDQQRLFDRHWRGSASQYQGSGLGLSIAAGIVEAHGGRMWVESIVDVGSTFFFSLPRQLADRGDAPPHAAAAERAVSG
jgi:signal transduction histidine kinase